VVLGNLALVGKKILTTYFSGDKVGYLQILNVNYGDRWTMQLTADELRKVRNELGWTQRAMCAKLGLTGQNYSAKENGRQGISHIMTCAVKLLVENEKLKKQVEELKYIKSRRM
jgi:DNA-binding XRE family transcriptional regulator